MSNENGFLVIYVLYLLLLPLLAITGSLRLAEKDRAERIFDGDATAFPAPSDFEWTVLVEDEGRVGVYGYDALSEEVLFEENFPEMNVTSSYQVFSYDGLKAALDEAEKCLRSRPSGGGPTTWSSLGPSGTADGIWSTGTRS
jgi:hypothetical protein